MALGITGQRQKNKLATVAIETLPTVPASEILKPGSLINRRIYLVRTKVQWS